ncbi:DUF190 domain-containing protein [Nitratifractor sp.]
MKRYLGVKKAARIYLDNSDTFEGKPLWQVLMNKVRQEGLAGATLYKAAAGIGAHTQLHTFEIWSLSQKLPVILEIIDDEEKVLEFLKKYDGMIGEGLVTFCDVEVLKYKSASTFE